MSSGTIKEEMTAVINRFGIEAVLKYAANEAAKRYGRLWKENKKLNDKNMDLHADLRESRKRR